MDTQASFDPRRSDRPLIELAAIVGHPRTGRRFTAEVVEISCEGCRLLTVEPMAYGDQLLVSVPGLARWPARVVWSQRGAAGVEFHCPLDPAVVARYVATFPPDLWTYPEGTRRAESLPVPQLFTSDR
ncbi:MAG TPA: PilZ domain-containing protein [Croceibacterium sp.]